MNNVDIIDLFDEEKEKKEKKELKKINKQKEKEKKMHDAYLKKLEKKEDVEFENYLKELHSNDVPKPVKKSTKEKIVKEKKETTVDSEKHPFLNFLLIIFSICLIVITADYVLFNSIINFKDIYTMINSIILALVVLFYILSLLIKKQGAKKFFEISSIIAMILFMSYHLFII